MDEGTNITEYKFDPNVDGGIFISPEGVEERIILDHRFMVTLTIGGKYRVYGPKDVQAKESQLIKVRSIEVNDDFKKAIDLYFYCMSMFAITIQNPMAAIKTLFKK